jgi:hypothetical protein
MLYTLAGLNTLTLHATVAGIHSVKGTLSCPQLSGGATAPSQVVVTVNQNASPMYVSTPGSEGFDVNLLCAVGDTITVVTSSAAAVDTASLNGIKAVIGFTQGLS